MTDFCLQIILSYLLGSVSGSLLLGRLRGVDIREFGSGNAGTTNAWRTEGGMFAVGVLLIDVLKGLVAVALIPHISMFSPLTVVALPVSTLICGFAVTVGHIYPIFFGFRGGRGVATLLGVFLVLAPMSLPYALVTFAVVLILSGMVALATIAAAVALVAAVVLLYQTPLTSGLAIFSFVMLALVIITHRANIGRMRMGSESRFERAMLFARIREKRAASGR